jgi:hypothetical protein
MITKHTRMKMLGGVRRSVSSESFGSIVFEALQDDVYRQFRTQGKCFEEVDC